MNVIQPDYYVLDIESKNIKSIFYPTDIKILQDTEILIAISKQKYNTDPSNDEETAATACMYHSIKTDFKHICRKKRMDCNIITDDSIDFVNYNKIMLCLYKQPISLLFQLDRDSFMENIIKLTRKHFYNTNLYTSGLYELYFCIEG